jgi:hypothetical protein
MIDWKMDFPSLAKNLLALLLVMGVSNFALAQIVNVEAQRPGQTDDGWHRSAMLNLSFQRNTSDILT